MSFKNSSFRIAVSSILMMCRSSSVSGAGVGGSKVEAIELSLDVHGSTESWCTSDCGDDRCADDGCGDDGGDTIDGVDTTALGCTK